MRKEPPVIVGDTPDTRLTHVSQTDTAPSWRELADNHRRAPPPNPLEPMDPAAAPVVGIGPVEQTRRSARARSAGLRTIQRVNSVESKLYREAR